MSKLVPWPPIKDSHTIQFESYDVVDDDTLPKVVGHIRCNDVFDAQTAASTWLAFEGVAYPGYKPVRVGNFFPSKEAAQAAIDAAKPTTN